MQGMDLTSNSYTDKLDISVSGTTPTGGYLNYENSILKDGCLTMDEYKVTIENGEVTTTEKGSCESVSLTACDSPNFKPSPEEWFTFDASTNTITGFSDAWDGTTDIVIPCSIGGAAVVKIKVSSFYRKELTSVITGDSIVYIDPNAFACNKINKLVLGENIKEIGPAAFNSNYLTEVKISKNVESISGGAFSANKISKLILNEELKVISGAAFANNDLSVVIIPKNVTSIGGNTFQKLRYGNNSELIDNPNLTTIYNNTGKSFDWGSIINGTSGYNFETGIVENEYGNVEVKKLN